jgi:chloramphenicol O-acetyltransferase
LHLPLPAAASIKPSLQAAMPRIDRYKAHLYIRYLSKNSDARLTKTAIPILTLTAIAKKQRTEKTAG